MKSVFFEEEAKIELRQSARYYDRQRPGLGSDFLAEVDIALDFIGRHPLASPTVRNNFRRTRVQRFPFDIIYAVEEEGIVVIAVMHQRRKPDYWKDRA